MKATLSHLALFCLFFTLIQADRYLYIEYNEIIVRLQDLALRYPRYARVIDLKSDSKNIQDLKCGQESCLFNAIKLTDFNIPSSEYRKLPQILIHGGFHGDEKLGPNIAYYLAEYILLKSEEDAEISKYLKSRVILIYPMPNPSGFFHASRDEIQPDGNKIDPYLDFSYNADIGKCFLTATSKILNNLFSTNLIQFVLGFNSGRGHFISYGWGSSNHELLALQESPDEKAIETFAQILAREAGNNEYLFIPTYNIFRNPGPNRGGGFDDWAYAGSWEKEFSPELIQTKCGSNLEELATNNNNALRAIVFNVHISDSKVPSLAYLGGEVSLEPSTQDKYAYGYVPMNIKLALTLFDIAQPTININLFSYNKHDNILTIEWRALGCKEVDSTFITWKGVRESEFKKGRPLNGSGYYDSKEQIFKDHIEFNENSNYDVIIHLSCDHSWNTQQNPSPKALPQSHIVRARLDENYNVKGHDNDVVSTKFVKLEFKDVSPSYFDMKRIKSIMDLTLIAEFRTCNSFVPIGSVQIQILIKNEQLYLSTNGVIGVSDPFLEGHIHEYADFTRCKEGLGEFYRVRKDGNNEFDGSKLFDTLKTEDTKSIKINYLMKMDSRDIIENLIGRSIFLERKTYSDQIAIAQLLPSQPSTCRKEAKEMKGCLGTDLGDDTGICNVKVIFEDNQLSFKLQIKANSAKTGLLIEGYLPSSLPKRYYEFNEVNIVNEKTEKKFSIDKKWIPGLVKIRQGELDMYPGLALGNTLRLFVSAFGENLMIGECSIVRGDPNVDIIKEVLGEYESKQDSIQYDNQQRLNLVIYIMAAFFVFIIICVAFKFIMKRVKKNTFEEMISTRREAFQHTETARQIATSRNLNTARPGQTARYDETRRTMQVGKGYYTDRSSNPRSELEQELEMRRNIRVLDELNRSDM